MFINKSAEISTTSALATTTSDEEASFVGGVVYKNITNPNITDFIDAAVNHDGSWLFLVKTLLQNSKKLLIKLLTARKRAKKN